MIELFKVIQVDNFDRETVAHRLIQADMTEADADVLRQELCSALDRDCSIWYRVVPNDQRLWRGMADLVGDCDS